MLITIDTSKQAPLDWTARGIDRIAQNVRNLIRTWRYDVAYDRTLGIDPAIMDKPADTAAAMYASEIFRIVDDNEPRATVKEVKYIGTDDSGDMQFRVVIEV